MNVYDSVHVKHFGYAGTKDARAITVQTLTMKSVKPGRIVMAQEELKKSGICLGNFKYVLVSYKAMHFIYFVQSL